MSNADPNSTLSPTDAFLALAKKRAKRCIDAEKDNREKAIELLKFVNGEDHWSQTEKQDRDNDGRPALTINLTRKFIRQLVGEQRQNRSQPKVRPIGGLATVQLAQTREGLIRNIEYQSYADAICDQAAEQMFSCGYGAWGVKTQWSEENPFLQEIKLRRIPNALTAYLDPDRKEIMGSDARFGFIFEKMSRDEFKGLFPKVDPPGSQFGEGTMDDDGWWDKDQVQVAEYYVKEIVKVKMCQLQDGSVMTEDEAKELIKEWDEENEQKLEMMRSVLDAAMDAPLRVKPQPVAKPPQPGPQPSAAPGAVPAIGGASAPNMPLPATSGPQPHPGSNAPAPAAQLPSTPPGKPKPQIMRTREVDDVVIKMYIITATEILSENGLKGVKIPGKYIPIVLCTGPELNINGRTKVLALCTDAVDVQKLVNYWHTAALELIAIQPKAPIFATAKQMEGYEDLYATAHIKNYPVLPYKMDVSSGVPAPPPMRQSPPNPPTAIFTEIRMQEENLKSTIGMFNADLGDTGPERTGAAIIARQKPSDVGVFMFFDNVDRAKEHTYRIINEMIPEVYDSARDVRLRQEDDTEYWAPANQPAGDVMETIENDPERYLTPKIMPELTSFIAKNGRGKHFYDLTLGKYGVMVVTGPSYGTQRQEAAQNLIALSQALGPKSAIFLDLIFKNLDIKDAEEARRRAKKLLPPGMAQPEEGDLPSAPPPPPPQVMVMLEKTKLAQIQQKKEMVAYQVKLVELYKELKESDKELKQKVLEILGSVFAKDHPADKIIGAPGSVPGMQPPQGAV